MVNKNLFPENIFGFFTWPDFYRDIVTKFQSGSTFVEVGVLEGASLSFLISEIINAEKDIKVIAVDYFDDICISKNSLEKFRENMKLAQDRFTLFVEESAVAAQRFPDKSLDFVFIDAAHDYENVRTDIMAWLPKMKIDGIMAGHDYIPTYPGVVKAVDEIFKDKVDKKYAYEGCWMVDLKTLSDE